MAVIKSKIENFPVILSSATPALETYANAVSGKYHHFLLSQKFGSYNKINLIDLRQEKLENNLIICNKLKVEILKNLQNNQQTLLFLNRRGYAPVSMCKSCGKKYVCPNCDFNLVLHKNKNQLTCHHCGHHEKIEKNCKYCQADDSIISLGFGVEKLTQEVENFAKDARILTITSDSVTNFSEAENIVNKILNNEVDIIIGTQMIAKGYDFPKLNLVGIVDADSMLYSSDLRALERSFQILLQVIGRAGRRDQDGKIFIQTYNPKNFLFENIDKDKAEFYKFELNNRKMLNLPPYSRMARIEVSALEEYQAKTFAKDLIKYFPFNENVEIHGPASAPLQKLHNRHHFLLHLKAHKKINLQKLIANVLTSCEIDRKIRIRVNIDP
jgi:primosomal protein N' (replication factor Y)